MERFDPAEALSAHKLKTFGQVALAIVQGKGGLSDSQFSAHGSSFLSDVPRLVSHARDATRAAMIMRDASGVSVSTDSGLSEWADISAAFMQSAVAASILGRIRGTRPVLFQRGQLIQTVFGTASWVGEAEQKPVEATEFGFFSVPARKVSVIAILSQEALTIRGADTLLRAYLQNAVAEKIDTTLAYRLAEVTDESPAGLASDAVAVASTGATVAAITADLRSMVDVMVTARVSLDAAGWILSPQAWALFQLLKIADAGGTLAGFPVVSSSAADGTVMLLAASYLSVATDGPVTIDASQEATLTVDGTTYSLYQKNLVGIRAEAWVNWNLSGPADTNGHYAAVVLAGH